MTSSNIDWKPRLEMEFDNMDEAYQFNLLTVHMRALKLENFMQTRIKMVLYHHLGLFVLRKGYKR